MKKTINELKKDLIKNGFEIYTLNQLENDEDYDMVNELKEEKANICLSLSVIARQWFFTSFESMFAYFNEGNQVGYDNCSICLR